MNEEDAMKLFEAVANSAKENPALKLILMHMLTTGCTLEEAKAKVRLDLKTPDIAHVNKDFVRNVTSKIISKKK